MSNESFCCFGVYLRKVGPLLLFVCVGVSVCVCGVCVCLCAWLWVCAWECVQLGPAQLDFENSSDKGQFRFRRMCCWVRRRQLIPPNLVSRHLTFWVSWHARCITLTMGSKPNRKREGSSHVTTGIGYRGHLILPHRQTNKTQQKNAPVMTRAIHNEKCCSWQNHR